MKTLQDIKEETAIDMGFMNWREVLRWSKRLSVTQVESIYDSITYKYSDQKSNVGNNN